MKSIYWQGKIYEGVQHKFTRFDGNMMGWECYLEQCVNYPCPQPHLFKDGQELVKGVDYKLRCDPHFKTCMCRDVEKCEHEIAVPLNPIN